MHPAGRLDVDSSDRDERNTAGSDDDGSVVATEGSTSGLQDFASDLDAHAMSDATSHSGSSTTTSGGKAGGAGVGALPGDAKNIVGSAGGVGGVQEVAEEDPPSTVFFVLRGAMAGLGAVFIFVQLLRLRGRTAHVATAPMRRGYHHQAGAGR